MRVPRRVQLSRARGFRLAAGVVNCARPGRYGNPFRIGDPGTPDAATAVQQFRLFAEECLRKDPTIFDPLRGQDLACWCRLDRLCHVDILLELANAEPPAPRDPDTLELRLVDGASQLGVGSSAAQIMLEAAAELLRIRAAYAYLTEALAAADERRTEVRVLGGTP